MSFLDTTIPSYLHQPKQFISWHPTKISGQIIIFHQPGFPWNKGISLPKPPFGVRSCEVAIIWPEDIDSQRHQRQSLVNVNPSGDGSSFRRHCEGSSSNDLDNQDDKWWEVLKMMVLTTSIIIYTRCNMHIKYIISYVYSNIYIYTHYVFM